MDQNSGQGEIMKLNNNLHVIASTLKTVASEAVTAKELAQEDKPLEEVLNEKAEETPQQSERE